MVKPLGNAIGRSLGLAPAGPLPTDEEPIPDFAPSLASDEAWRELQRRRNLIKLIRALAENARDEGFSFSSMLLTETAERVRLRLIRPPSTEERDREAQTAMTIPTEEARLAAARRE